MAVPPVTGLHQPIVFRPARPEDIPALDALCFRSKAMWGYDDAFMAACRHELTTRTCDLELTLIAETGGDLQGMVQIGWAGDAADLLKMFVAPEAVRQGIGQELYRWAIETAKAAGADRMIIDADPNAADFYRRMGASDDGTVPSGSIPGRRLPRLVHVLGVGGTGGDAEDQT